MSLKHTRYQVPGNLRSDLVFHDPTVLRRRILILLHHDHSSPQSLRGLHVCLPQSILRHSCRLELEVSRFYAFTALIFDSYQVSFVIPFPRRNTLRNPTFVWRSSKTNTGKIPNGIAACKMVRDERRGTNRCGRGVWIMKKRSLFSLLHTSHPIPSHPSITTLLE